MISEAQLIEGITILLSFPFYATIFRKIKYFGKTYFGYMIMYGMPTFFTWITRKIVMIQYIRWKNND